MACADLVYGMLQSPGSSGGDTLKVGAKETETGEESRRRTRDRTRAKSFGPQDEVRLRRGMTSTEGR
jgi:hypothetical protein